MLPSPQPAQPNSPTLVCQFTILIPVLQNAPHVPPTKPINPPRPNHKRTAQPASHQIKIPMTTSLSSPLPTPDSPTLNSNMQPLEILTSPIHGDARSPVANFNSPKLAVDYCVDEARFTLTRRRLIHVKREAMKICNSTSND